jgi:hypothetical protein
MRLPSLKSGGHLQIVGHELLRISLAITSVFGVPAFAFAPLSHPGKGAKTVKTRAFVDRMCPIAPFLAR